MTDLKSLRAVAEKATSVCFMKEGVEESGLGFTEFLGDMPNADFLALLDRIERLERALKFYADEHSWEGLVHIKNGEWSGWDGTLIANDNGTRAREALGVEGEK